MSAQHGSQKCSGFDVEKPEKQEDPSGTCGGSQPVMIPDAKETLLSPQCTGKFRADNCSGLCKIKPCSTGLLGIRNVSLEPESENFTDPGGKTKNVTDPGRHFSFCCLDTNESELETIDPG